MVGGEGGWGGGAPCLSGRDGRRLLQRNRSEFSFAGILARSLHLAILGAFATNHKLRMHIFDLSGSAR